MIARTAALALEALSAALLMGLVLVTCVDVVGRYALNAPLSGAFELTQLMLGALVFAALPLVSRAGEHVEVDLAVQFMDARVRRATGLFAAVFSALVLAYFAWRLGVVAAELGADGARSQALGLPHAPLAAAGAAACALSAVITLARSFR